MPDRRRHPLFIAAAMAFAMAMVAGACSNTHERPPIQFPPSASPSRIVDAQGRLITTIADENRRSVSFDEIPFTMQQAIVAIEDSRFWSHDGVDPRAIARAADANADAGKVSEGGSTITQQYVKTALLDDERTIGRKIEEATLALALERAYSKEVILEKYLNTIYFGAGAYGIEVAANEYFGSAAADLTLPQAALLAGIVQAPTRHDPRAHPDGALARRNLVLQRMEEQGYITSEQEQTASDSPLGVLADGPAPELERYPAPHFVEEVKRWLLSESDALGDNQAERYDNLLRGGLTITTTIDLDVQAKAEAAIAAVLPGQGVNPKIPDAAMTAIEPDTGYIRAMVGGRDFWGGYSYAKTNLAEGAGRQTGSTFKPIVLATALSQGVSTTETFAAPSSGVFSNPGSDPWRVKGNGGLGGGGNLSQCTVVSSNTCYANIMLDPRVGPDRAVDMAERLGVTSHPLGRYPSAVLGSNEITTKDMASVFATFANGGVHVPPTYVTKVERSDGTVLYEHSHTQSKVLEPEVARTVNDILPGVISAPNGTGNAAAVAWPAGGKTGSTNNNTDAWFCGYTHQLASAVWVGFAEPVPGSGLKSMVAGNTPINVYGGTYPAEIWAAFTSAAMEGQPPTALNPPLPPPTTTTAPPAQSDILTPVTAPSSTEVPDVVDMTGDAAERALEKVGLVVERKEVEAGATAAPGLVVAQAPSSGSTVPSGTTVWLEVSKGTPASTTPVPDLRGFGTGQATQRLQQLGFTVATRVAAPPAGTLSPAGQSYVAGQVWRTVPTAGQLAADGRVILEYTPLSSEATTVPPPATTTTVP